ncbi:NAD(P)/FAD-dependent oxidoreductase [Albirhodobacter sp. R86504]|uniref:NAD(P)/FAD-dependent oxidoreductase n=1 Tax=Albirhodobacter sp. R86504 TaxID=3093848 RepID=UPI00367049C3
MENFDVIILGAGAAGLYAGIEAGRRGRRVLVVDHARAPGEKIRISGGGRCNFTNLSAGDRNLCQTRFVSQNPRFALSALTRHRPEAFIARLDRAGITWHEKTLGQLFCDGKATQIVTMLTDDLRDAGGVLWLGCEIYNMSKDADGFTVETSEGDVRAASVIVATGGKSIPKMGATSIGYKIAEQFGLALEETRPALVPLTLADQELARTAPLAGVSVMARAGVGKTRFDEALLFTHRGLSGPSILQISSYWREGDALVADLAPQTDIAGALKDMRGQAGKVAIHNALSRLLPERLAQYLCEEAQVAGRLADLSNPVIDQLASKVHAWEIRPVGSEGYRTAEVTLGGVSTAELDAKTLEAKRVPGLYFIGEVVDVTGWLGGYNFQWAWASGWAAGQVA